MESPWTGSVHENECLSSCNLVLEFQGSPGELPIFNLCWNPKKVVFSISEEMSQVQDKGTCQ